MTTSNEHNNAPAVARPWLQSLGELVSAAKNRDASRRDQEAAINAAHADLFNILRTLQPTIEQDAPAVPQGEPVDFDSIIEDVEAIDCRYRGDPSYDRDPYYIREEAANVVRRHATYYATPAPAPAQGEPFGHFRAEPFGWTDCAKDDEGAIALYERPQEVVIPQGYEIHELPTDYSGPVWIESQVRYMARQNACASQPTTDTEVGAQEVGLTDEEIKHVCAGIYLSDHPQGSASYDVALARAIIAALRAKGGKHV